ncbi:MAG TPA: FAD-dependent oxidoreductase [Rhodothermales bacterium]|nr:FAD-dependent oxidoreductase [Rhodothermales bacterium]HRR08550.1 FAD-dependent oxidoreductase [Rhodothermales bacterium]
MSNIVVIGGGVIGLCTAYYALQEGHNVTVLEKGEVGKGSSWANAGWITPSHVVPLAAPGVIRKGLKWMLDPESPFYIKPRIEIELFRWLWAFRSYATQTHVNRCIPILGTLCEESLNLFKALSQALGDQVGFEEKSLIFAAKTDAGLKYCIHEVEVVKKVGMAARVLDLNEMCEMEPTLRTDLKGGAFFKIDAHLNPAKLMVHLAKYIRANGGRIVENTTVNGFELGKKEVKNVQTTHQQFEADYVVLAMGAWSKEVNEALKLRLPIQPGKGYSITLPQTGTLTRMPILLSERSVAITPFGNEIRYAGTMELAGMDLSVNQRRVQAIKNAAQEYLINYDAEVAQQAIPWAGLRPCSPDGMPLVGPLQTFPNVLVATGHAMIGVTSATGTGKIISDLISGKTSFMDPLPFAPERF